MDKWKIGKWKIGKWSLDKLNLESFRKWIIPGLLVLVLAAVGTWGYREYYDRQRLQNRAESQYQLSFHELSWHVDMISGQLAQLIVASSKEQNVLGLATVWRQVFAAQANIGGLPLAFVPLSKTEKFLFDAGEVSFALLSRVTQSNAGLADQDAEIIAELYDRAKLLKNELASMGAQILNRQLSWTQVEMAALQFNGELEDNTIINGFQLMEKKMEEYPEINLGDDFAQVKPDVKKVEGNMEISPGKAIEIARNWWFGQEDKHTGKLTYEGVGDVPTYGIEFEPQSQETVPVYVDISKLDGTIIWAMRPKDSIGANIDLSNGERRGLAFLQAHGFNNMVLVKVEQQDTMGVYTFVPRQGEVLLYPDQVKVQVALDNGEITGYEGTPYYMFHKDRALPVASLSEVQLRKQISPNLNVELIRPALISNYWGKEILAWEVRGSYEEEKFVLFYNAITGSEEEISRITPTQKFEFDVTA